MGLGLEPLSFISIGWINQLGKQLKNITEDQAQELNQLREDFTDPTELIKYYVEPHLQGGDPNPRHNTIHFPIPRESAFALINRFFDGGTPEN
ncbi:MAG: hypothetical protein D3924_14605, partial [Candidatus Electrothrix sp. AR4]|nr:hypothetical protein [Candidatus Electrothrix sp. AR4]